MLFRQQASEAIVNLPNTVLGDPAESPEATMGPILGAPIPPSMPARVVPVRTVDAPALPGVAAPPPGAPRPAAPPPELSKSYPQEVPPGWPSPLRWAQPAAAHEKPVVHKIRDGDTLSALAQRYLGSPARAVEIFDANREILSNPELLPIGAELKIPPRDPQGEAQRPLVPVTQGPVPAGK
jgi:nucleoid-associated protein YgaU